MVEVLEKRKPRTTAEIKTKWSGPSNNLLIEQKSVVVDGPYGSRKKEKQSGGQNIEKSVQTLTIVTTELMSWKLSVPSSTQTPSPPTNHPPFDKADIP